METQTPSLESVQEVRLLALLHDLVRKDGRTGAAAALGVHRKTVAAAVNTGRLSRRMHDALGQHLLAGQAADAPTASVAEARRQWEQHLEGALRRQREELLAAISAQGKQLRDAAAQRTQALEGRLAALEAHRQEGGEAAPLGRTTRDAPPVAPQVVTAAPAPGEAAAFGVAAPLIVRWRQARDTRAGAGDHLTAVRAEERLRELELALIGAYHLTLPPATYPWDELTRRHEVGLAPADLGARARRAPPGGVAAPAAPGADTRIGVSRMAAAWEHHARKHLGWAGRNPLSPTGGSRNTEHVFRLCQVFPPEKPGGPALYPGETERIEPCSPAGPHEGTAAVTQGVIPSPAAQSSG